MLTRQIGVVVPARDEEERLPACLAALQRAAAHPAVPPVRIVVVADTCQDRTAEVARRAGAEVLEVCTGSAGGARRAGMEILIGTRVVPLAELWLATTDADSEVPPGWLSMHVRLARAGWDAVAGTVVVDDWRPEQAALARRFARLYGPVRDGHPHVHGANLGCSADAYRRAGGFPDVALGEDHHLVEALAACGAAVARPGGRPVATSSRTDARASGGFGHLLASLARALPAGPKPQRATTATVTTRPATR